MSNIENILSQLAPDLKKVDQIILEFAVGKSPLIAEISNHLISSGGKRIRPILLILAAKLCGAKDQKKPQDLAAAVELIHSATLLHDDVVDTSQVRRGKKTANAIWDNKASILVGDYLFSIAFQLMVRVKNLEVLGLLAKASSIMADGEVMQLENSSDVALSQEKYFEIIFGKTAVLFAAACESGALVSDASEAEVTALREFGTNLGIIFQIVDDILDYSSDEKVLGKDVGNDFFEGKVTLPIILLHQKADKVEQKFISDTFTKNLLASERSATDFAQFLELLKKHQALEACKNMASKHHELAVQNLEIFSDSNFKKDLVAILDYSLARIF
jgi:octaprenyl-diphosphate synthase